MKTGVIAAVLLVWATGLSAQDDTPTVSVVGQGQVAAAPDMAVISLGVTHTDASAKAAMDRVSVDARALLAELEALGVAPRDVQTSQLSVSPIWDNGNGTQPRRITGFVARNALTLRVRDLAGLGAVMDAALEAGSNDFNGLRFGLQDSDTAQGAARAAAVRDAITRATQLAEAAGLSLGPIQTMTEQSFGGRPEMLAADMRSSGMPVAAGELTVSASVSVTFALTP
ncbi:MAG: SIMPL domain-containing protein [Pseudomonadota bacterium]